MAYAYSPSKLTDKLDRRSKNDGEQAGIAIKTRRVIGK